jgi:hypothetical protein
MLSPPSASSRQQDTGVVWGLHLRLVGLWEGLTLGNLWVSLIQPSLSHSAPFKSWG